jgi:hypothetical protein
MWTPHIKLFLFFFPLFSRKSSGELKAADNPCKCHRVHQQAVGPLARFVCSWHASSENVTALPTRLPVIPTSSTVIITVSFIPHTQLARHAFTAAAEM